MKTLLLNLFFLTKLFNVLSNWLIGQLIFKNSLIILETFLPFLALLGSFIFWSNLFNISLQKSAVFIVFGIATVLFSLVFTSYLYTLPPDQDTKYLLRPNLLWINTLILFFVTYFFNKVTRDLEKKDTSKVKKNLLIIKHGALGDFILSFGPFKSIRDYHINDHIVLLTNSIFKEFAEESNYFDEIIIDDRPVFWNFKKYIFKCNFNFWVSWKY